jgi:hypothetical protein
MTRASRVSFHDQSHVCLEGAEGFRHLRGGGLNSRAFSRGAGCPSVAANRASWSASMMVGTTVQAGLEALRQSPA